MTRGKTIIMVTHEDDIAACAKRIIKMRDGLIIDDSPSPRMQQRLQNGAVDPKAVAAEPTASGPATRPARNRADRPERRTDTLTRNRWDASGAALKLGMKSLLLHKLRSGLTVLGIVFGVAAVISMLAIAEGHQPRGPGTDPALGRDEHHHSLGEAQRRCPGLRRQSALRRFSTTG